LAKEIGDVTETLRVQDFGTPEDLGCSITERPKDGDCGWKALDEKNVIETLEWRI
jgi:hypothetical protein